MKKLLLLLLVVLSLSSSAAYCAACSDVRGLVNVSGGTYDGVSTGACVDPATQLDMEAHEASGHPLIISTQSPTTGDITGAAGNHYLVDISGLTADRSLTLPTATASDRLRVTLTAGDADYELILKGAATVTINGGSAATEWSRLFIAGETVEFEATSSTNWQVHVDGRKPSSAILGTLGTDPDQTVTSGVWSQIEMSTEIADVGDLADLTNDQVKIRRAGIYVCYVSNGIVQGFTTGSVVTRIACRTSDGNNVNISPKAFWAYEASMQPGSVSTGVGTLTADVTYLYARFLTTGSGTLFMPDTGGGLISVQEIIH